MFGAIIGDMCGSTYEWANEKDITKIELLREGSFPTDDSVMTAAVARALTDTVGMSDCDIENAVITSMHYFGNLFPDAGYGGTFYRWLMTYNRRPYNSWGNGSGMRVAPAGWLYDSLEETLHAAELTAAVTHNHPEGIKGAKAIAACVYLARTGKSKDEIKAFVENNYYKLNFTLDSIRKAYEFDVSCQGSCPQAIEAFLESNDFEDAIRKAISVGGDSDTIACMTGGIAEAFYGIPDEIKEKAFAILVNQEKGLNVYNDRVIAEEVKRFWGFLGERK